MREKLEELIGFYKELDKFHQWERVSAEMMRELVELILEKRNIDDLFPKENHTILCIKRYEYPKSLDKPYIQIFPESTGRYKISFVEPIEKGEIYREKVENVFCNINHFLQIFDEMVAKLRSMD